MEGWELSDKELACILGYHDIDLVAENIPYKEYKVAGKAYQKKLVEWMLETFHVAGSCMYIDDDDVKWQDILKSVGLK